MDTTTILPISALAAAVLSLWVIRQDLATPQPMEAVAELVHMQAHANDLVVLQGEGLRHHVPRFAPLATVATGQLPEGASAFGRVFVIHRSEEDAIVQELGRAGFLLWQRQVPPLSIALFQLHAAELQVVGLEALLPAAEVALVDAVGDETGCAWIGTGHRCAQAFESTDWHAVVAPLGEPRRCVRLRSDVAHSTRVVLPSPQPATHLAGWFALDEQLSSPGASATLEIDAGAASRTVLVSPNRKLAQVDWALPSEAGATTALHLRADGGAVTVCGELRWVERASGQVP